MELTIQEKEEILHLSKEYIGETDASRKYWLKYAMYSIVEPYINKFVEAKMSEELIKIEELFRLKDK